VFKRTLIFTILFILILSSLGISIGCQESGQTTQPVRTVPHNTEYGIYKLDIATQDIILVYSFPENSYPSGLRLNHQGDKFIFDQKMKNQGDEATEIYTVGIDGKNLIKITDNDYWDLYPVWSSDESQIAFLTWRDDDLDIYVMDADGSNDRLLYDSGDHDADINWVGNKIVFTAYSAIWIMNDDGTEPMQVTDYPDRGEWGNANLPAGDYDPRLSPDGSKIAFHRMEDTSPVHGGYNVFVINSDGTGETRLTNNLYSQGLVSWSHSGEELTYIVAAIDGQGKYDIYIVNSDGTNNYNITPDYFPADFVCHHPNFSIDDSSIYFIGQWWQDN
jgi:Tol biopolymer transport system component